MGPGVKLGRSGPSPEGQQSGMDRDPFDVLGLPATFDLARDAVERSYLARAGRLHPDLAGGGAEGEADSQAATAELNRAARVLRDPESRANALLARLGGPAKEADKSLPEGFLASMLETRMEIEADAGDPAARARWEAWAVARRAEYAAACREAFGGLGATPAPGALAGIRRTLNAWRYIERLIEQLDPDYDPARADFPT